MTPTQILNRIIREHDKLVNPQYRITNPVGFRKSLAKLRTDRVTLEPAITRSGYAEVLMI